MTDRIPALDRQAAQAMQARLDRKTKPLGSLGRLEELAVSLAGMGGDLPGGFKRRAVLVAAADHGIARQGVSAYPPEVTPQMVLNFLAGGAAINVLAKQGGARVLVLDAGVNDASAPLPLHAGLLRRPVAPGTADFSQGPAMTRAQAEACVQAGREAVSQLAAEGLDLLAVGEMGIGNTTAASAICAALLQLPVAQVTGRGTGLDVAGWEKKVAILEKALALHQPQATDAWDVLCKVGGFEIGALAGALMEASARRIPVILDGFITGAAALLANAWAPEAKGYWLASHQSVEIGHRHLLERLGLRAYLNLDLRLGEGSGAALMFPLVDAVCAIVRDMATFDSAGVSDKEAGQAV
jgi:nicotinate-nucleotide--dimethylbenzimidazole phosphoribosyltransferase